MTNWGLRRGDPVILNTDVAGGPGVHWIVIVKIDGWNMPDGSVHEAYRSTPTFYVVDSLGQKNKRVTATGQPIDEMLKKALQSGNGQVAKIFYYPNAIQQRSNVLCGYYALLNAALIRQHFHKKQGRRVSANELTELLNHHWIDKRKEAADTPATARNLQVLADAFGPSGSAAPTK